MLQSYVGTFDSAGLRSLRTEEDASARTRKVDGTAMRFWAILDTSELPLIQSALMLGHRGTALEMVALQAKSLGRLCN